MKPSFVIRNKLIVSFLLLVVVFVAAAGLKRLSLKTDSRQYFGPDNVQLIAYEELEKKFTERNEVFFSVESKSGEIFERETLKAIIELTDAAWSLPHAYRVDSLTNYQHVAVEGDDLFVGDFIESPQNLSDSALAERKAIALQDTVILNRMISPESSVAGVFVSIRLPEDDNKAGVLVANSAKQLASDFAQKYSDLNFRITGSIMINGAFAEASLKDFKTLVPLMYLCVYIILALLLRSAITVISILFINILTGISTFGTAGWLGISLSPQAISAVNVIMTVVVAYCVHISVTFFHEYRKNGRPDSAGVAVDNNFYPIFLSALTTVVGFLSLNFSDVPPIAAFGSIVALGVFYSFVFSVFLLPVVLSILPIKKITVRGTLLEQAMLSLANFVLANTRRIAVFLVLLISVLAFYAPSNTVSDNYTQYIDESVQFRSDTDFTDQHLAGLYSIEYVLNSGAESGITSIEYLNSLDSFATWLRQQPETEHVSVFSDTLKQINQNMHAGDEAYYKLPENKKLASQYLLLYELSLQYRLDLRTTIDYLKTSTLLRVSIPSTTSDDFIAFQNRASQWLRDNAPSSMHYEGSSISLMFAYIGKQAMQESIWNTLVALLLISLILLFTLRSIKLGVISLIPNLFPAIVGFGIWALLSGKIGLSMASVLGITMGIVVDDTVHFLSKYKKYRKQGLLSVEASIRNTFQSVGPALSVTTLVLVAGFSLLSLSLYKPNADLGLMASVIIVAALMIDFLLLPILLIWFDRDDRKTEKIA